MSHNLWEWPVDKKKNPFKDIINELGVNRQKKQDRFLRLEKPPKPKRRPQKKEPGIGDLLRDPRFKKHPINPPKRLYKDEQEV